MHNLIDRRMKMDPSNWLFKTSFLLKTIEFSTVSKLKSIGNIYLKTLVACRCQLIIIHTIPTSTDWQENKGLYKMVSFFLFFLNLYSGKLFSLAHSRLLGSFFLRLSACVLLSIVRIFRSLVYKSLMSGFEESRYFRWSKQTLLMV